MFFPLRKIPADVSRLAFDTFWIAATPDDAAAQPSSAPLANLKSLARRKLSILIPTFASDRLFLTD